MRQAKPNTKSILQIAKRQTVETETLHSTCALEDWATSLLVWFCMFYDVVSNAIQSGSKQWVIRWSSVRNQTSNLLTNFGFNKSTTLKVWSYWMSLGVINQLTTEGGRHQLVQYGIWIWVKKSSTFLYMTLHRWQADVHLTKMRSPYTVGFDAQEQVEPRMMKK